MKNQHYKELKRFVVFCFGNSDFPCISFLEKTDDFNYSDLLSKATDNDLCLTGESSKYFLKKSNKRIEEIHLSEILLSDKMVSDLLDLKQEYIYNP